MRPFYLIITLLLSFQVYSQHGRFIDHRCTDLTQIPNEYITAAKQNLKIQYFRRSHGSQVDTGGMNALRTYSPAYASKYAYSKTGGNGTLMLSTTWASADFENLTWVQLTKDFLNDPANSKINVVMWAWSSKFFECNAQQYVNDMEALIREYGPGGTRIISGARNVPVTFVFQTACGNYGWDINPIIYSGNWIIRNHCIAHNRILFDFNDIECFDPDGNYYGDGNPPGGTYTNKRVLNDDLAYKSDSTNVSVLDGFGNWGIEWMKRNPNSELTKLAANNICITCAHSEGVNQYETKDNSRLHCVLKGRAAWWLFAILAGWEDGVSGIDNLNKFDAFQLKNYPNPFSNNTIIEYTLTKKSKIKLELWNNQGQKIEVLEQGERTEGVHKVPLSIKNAKGLYYYTLEVNGLRTTKRMINL